MIPMLAYTHIVVLESHSLVAVRQGLVLAVEQGRSFIKLHRWSHSLADGQSIIVILTLAATIGATFVLLTVRISPAVLQS